MGNDGQPLKIGYIPSMERFGEDFRWTRKRTADATSSTMDIQRGNAKIHLVLKMDYAKNALIKSPKL
jgi:hypothetical protein